MREDVVPNEVERSFQNKPAIFSLLVADLLLCDFSMLMISTWRDPSVVALPPHGVDKISIITIY
jgi:hypothetical protein